MPISQVITDTMRTQIARLDTLANNLANADSPGFKRLMLVESAQGNRTVVDTRPALLQPSTNPMDLALEGPGFFVTQGNDGVHLTRDGRFRAGVDGILRSSMGETVMGTDGPIRLRQGAVDITPEGQVRQGGTTVARLRIVEPQSQRLVPTGAGNYRDDGSAAVAQKTRVHSTTLEGSNVQALDEITILMEASRRLEVAQKAYQAVGEMNKKLTDEVGRTR